MQTIIDQSVPVLAEKLGLEAETFNELMMKYDQRNIDQLIAQALESQDFTPLVQYVLSASLLEIRYIRKKLTVEEATDFLRELASVEDTSGILSSFLDPYPEKEMKEIVYKMIKALDWKYFRKESLTVAENTILRNVVATNKVTGVIDQGLFAVDKFIASQIEEQGPEYILYLDGLMYGKNYVTRIVVNLIDKEWDYKGLFDLPLSNSLQHHILASLAEKLLPFRRAANKDLLRNAFDELYSKMEYDPDFDLRGTGSTHGPIKRALDL